jgi:hypothetical protein
MPHACEQRNSMLRVGKQRGEACMHAQGRGRHLFVAAG